MAPDTPLQIPTVEDLVAFHLRWKMLPLLDSPTHPPPPTASQWQRHLHSLLRTSFLNRLFRVLPAKTKLDSASRKQRLFDRLIAPVLPRTVTREQLSTGLPEQSRLAYGAIIYNLFFATDPPGKQYMSTFLKAPLQRSMVNEGEEIWPAAKDAAMQYLGAGRKSQNWWGDVEPLLYRYPAVVFLLYWYGYRPLLFQEADTARKRQRIHRQREQRWNQFLGSRTIVDETLESLLRHPTQGGPRITRSEPVKVPVPPIEQQSQQSETLMSQGQPAEPVESGKEEVPMDPSRRHVSQSCHPRDDISAPARKTRLGDEARKSSSNGTAAPSNGPLSTRNIKTRRRLQAIVDKGQSENDTHIIRQAKMLLRELEPES